MPDKSREMQDKMAALRPLFMEQLKKRSEGVEESLALLEKGALKAEGRERLQSLAHMLSGSGTTFGHPEITEHAKAVEQFMLNLEAGDDKELVKLTRTLLKTCTSILKGGPKPAKAEKKQPPKAAAETRAALPIVLVADDDETVRTLISGLLKGEAQILAAANTKEAKKLIESHKPDLVLLDDMMPGGASGLELLAEIISIPGMQNIPVIMITASDSPEKVMQGLMAGAADYITKPFDSASVKQKIHNRLQRLGSEILIADDDETVRELLSHKFRSAGCRVAVAEDGADAWAMMQKEAYALVVLDRMMPGYDGITLLRMMREKKKLAETPVVFLTARHYGADVLEGLNTGAADYITKPFNPDEVVARCLRLLKPETGAKKR